MRLRNESRLDTARLTGLLEFAARGVNDSGVFVHAIDSTSTFRGWAAGPGSFTRRRPVSRDPMRTGRWAVKQVYPAGADYLIRLFIPAVIPLQNWTNVKRMLRLYPSGLPPFESEDDAIVMLAAHEFRHTWQYRHRKSGKGEYDAEKFAMRRLNDWREHTGRPRVDPVKQANPFAARVHAEVVSP